VNPLISPELLPSKWQLVGSDIPKNKDKAKEDKKASSSSIEDVNQGKKNGRPTGRRKRRRNQNGPRF
jgi:hypothetical protein